MLHVLHTTYPGIHLHSEQRHRVRLISSHHIILYTPHPPITTHTSHTHHTRIIHPSHHHFTNPSIPTIYIFRTSTCTPASCRKRRTEKGISHPAIEPKPMHNPGRKKESEKRKKISPHPGDVKCKEKHASAHTYIHAYVRPMISSHLVTALSHP